VTHAERIDRLTGAVAGEGWHVRPSAGASVERSELPA